jgi:predicted metalloprotease with PDZ domain
MPPRIEVEMTVPEVQGDTLEVQMPVWSPGDYHVQNHPKYVQKLTAQAERKPLTLEQPEEHTWRIRTEGASTVVVRYQLPQTPAGFFSENVQIRPKQVFLNGPSAYLYVVGKKHLPAQIQFVLPKEWQAVMPLPESKGEEGTATFTATDYDTLADSPIVMAHPDILKVESFTLRGKPHRIAFFGQSQNIADTKAYIPVLKRIMETHGRVMGSLPYGQYVFFFDVNGRGGGLEHLNSTRMAIGTGSPRQIAHFAAHESFHLWNVKRIRPKVLGPFDYVNPSKTRNLWFAEGVTDYYASMCVRRAGYVSDEQFMRQWGFMARSYQNLSSRLEVSADESSLRVWEAGNSSGYGISYYFKGHLIGLCLDLKIRHVTQGRRSLDDVMRELMQRGNLPKPGFDEDEIREVVNQVSGQDLSEFYDILIRKPGEMPFEECLGYVGLSVAGEPLSNATPAQIARREEWMRSFYTD